MKDIVIKGQYIKRELKILALAYLAANLLNVFAIWHYKTSWSELYLFQPMVLLITAILYAIAMMVRTIARLVRNQFFGKKP